MEPLINTVGLGNYNPANMVTNHGTIKQEKLV